MLPKFYLDASTLAKRYKTESGSNLINELFAYSSTNQELLFTTRHSIVEVASVFMRLKREHILSLNEAQHIIDRFLFESHKHIYFIGATTKIEFIAMDLMSKYSLKAADAIHVAVSIDLSNIIHSDLYVVCSDKQMCNAITAENLNLINPNDDISIQELLTIQ